MLASGLKRVSAAAIDVFLFIIIMLITSYFLSFYQSDNLTSKYIKLSENYQEEVLEGDEPIQTARAIKLKTELDSVSFQLYLITNIAICAVAVIYFSIIPIFLKGKTLGKLFSKCRVVSNKNAPLKLFLRGLLVSMIIIIKLPLYIVGLFSKDYTTLVYLDYALTAFCLIAVLISIILITLTDNKKSLHDLLVNTKVIND